MTKALQNHAAAIKAGTVTATNVIGMRKAINQVERRSAGWSVPASVPTRHEVDEVETLIETTRPIVTGTLHDTGLKALRNPKFAKRFSSDERCVIEAADAFFMLVGFERIGRGGMYATPIYRIRDMKNRGFNFTNVPWQSGGNGPEVVA